MNKLIFTLIAVMLASPAAAYDLCQGNTYRCSLLAECSLNGVVSQCAYASGGATNSAIRFPERTFDLHWRGQGLVDISEGDAKPAPAVMENGPSGFMTFKTNGGDVITIPNTIPHLQ